MGTDFQRTLLWVLFGMSLFMLWDRWLVHTGRPSMFGASAACANGSGHSGFARSAARYRAVRGAAARRTGDGHRCPAGGRTGGRGAVTSAPPARRLARRRLPPVLIETDLLRVSIDPEGAVLSRVELLQQRVAPDWTARGVVGLMTRRKHDPGCEGGPARCQPEPRLRGADRRRRRRFSESPHAVPLVTDGPKRVGDSYEVTFSAERGGCASTRPTCSTQGRYDALVRHELANVGAAPANPAVYLQIMRDGNKPEGESALYYTYTGPVVFTEGEKFKKVDFSSIERGRAEHPRAPTTAGSA
jgi:YidC/Oxa1 family membrane protein insertase